MPWKLKNIKAFTWVLPAILLLGLAFVRSAPAGEEPGILRAPTYPATLQGGGGATFNLTDANGAFKLSCSFSVSGSLQGKSSTFALHPEFSECKFGSLAALPPTTTGCDFGFHLGPTSGESSYSSRVDLDCEESEGIVFPSILNCSVVIDSQEEFGTVQVQNNGGSPSDVTIEWSIEGFSYTVLKDGAFCPLSSNGNKEDGDFTGEAMTVTSAEGIEVAMS